MRLHRFFAGNLSEAPENVGTSNRKEIAEGSTVYYAHGTHQWQRVFRFGAGDRVILFDGSGNDYVCEIQQYQGETAILNVVDVIQNKVKPVRNVILVSALVKKDTFEWIVEKATELGVSRIVPLIAERSEKKNINIERLQKIALEASEQSGRGDIPVIDVIVGFDNFMKTIESKSSVVFDVAGSKFSDADFGPEHFSSESGLTVFIGPEGGWSPVELDSFRKMNIKILSLGPQILRAETAVVAVVSRLVF